MTKKTKILLFLLAASALLFVYLLLSSETLVMEGTKNNGRAAPTVSENRTEPDKTVAAVDLQAVESEHRAEMSKILDDYTALVGEIGTGTTTGGDQNDLIRQAEEIKSRISGLKAPVAGYKDTHLDLVLSIDRMENFINGGDNAEKDDGLKLLAQARQNFESLSSGRN